MEGGMNVGRTALAVGLAFILASTARAQTADEIVGKNIQARGGLAKLKAAETVRITGRMSMGPMEAPFVMEWKRPNRMRMEFTVQGMTGVQAYDGKTGWMVMPFMGKTDPEPMPPEVLKDAEEQADFDGPLVDYKAKGHAIELAGKEQVEGAEAYKLKVTLKNGEVRYLFIDADSFLEIRGEAKRKMRGSEMEIEQSIGDYKEVGGLMVPHSIEVAAKGAPHRQKLTFEKVDFNVAIDDARFAMPAKKPESPKAEKPRP
jgi:outer membrane lipoprotein-sorting protein